MRRTLYQVIQCPLPRESITELGQKILLGWENFGWAWSVSQVSSWFNVSRRAARRAFYKLEKCGAVSRMGGHR